ncbi:MAG: DUF447 domain-containing protein [Planctomycetaceae bacterium]
MPLVLEGIVATTDAAGAPHLAPMGPHVADGERLRPRSLLLRPFADSRTAVHLERHPEGVFHVVDDCVLLARLVTGDRLPPVVGRAAAINGWVLEDYCRAFEFRIVAADRDGERQTLTAEVLRIDDRRPGFGWNRAAAAVVEGAVHVTRLHLLGQAEVARRLGELAAAVEKTGGEREREAFGMLVSAATLGRYAGDGQGPTAGSFADRPSR